MEYIEEHYNLVCNDKNYEYIGSEKRNKGNSKYKVWWIIIRHKYCNKISSIRLDAWKCEVRPHGKTKKDKCCCGSYENSFAYYIEIELGLNLDDIWNWEKNNELGINPYHISKYSHKDIWLYCLNHDYHNYNRERNKIGYKTTCKTFNLEKCRWPYCNTFASHKVHWKDSLAYNYPQIAKMIAIKENNLIFDDCYNIGCSSGKKFYFKCLECDMISTKKHSINEINNKGYYSCEYCSDGISIPNKFMANILKQLNIDFITELSSKKFSGKNYFYYDFYLPKYNMIIEINGLQHYEECMRGRTLFEEQINDLFKYKCAKNYVDKYIVIDCRYSELEWMKENIIKELSDYFDLSNINWELAWEESQNSLCIKAWELYNSGFTIKQIGDILQLDRHTISKYIKQGNKCKKIHIE